MITEKNQRKAAEMLRCEQNARETGGCPTCFKPHDPDAPGCNAHECIKRWEKIRAAARSPQPGDRA